MAKGLSFFNTNNDDDEEKNLTLYRKRFSIQFLTGRYVRFEQDLDENWIIIILSKEEQSEQNRELKDQEKKSSQNKIFIQKELSSSILGDPKKIKNNTHLIKDCYLVKSVYKSHSLLSLLGLTSPYLSYPSCFSIKFQLAGEEKLASNCNYDFFIEIGGGESRYGSGWIDTAIENIPKLIGDFFTQSERDNFYNLFNTDRLSWIMLESVYDNFNN